MNTRPTFTVYREADLTRERELSRGYVQPLMATPSRSLKSTDLFRGEREIGIEHEGSVYRLKITRQRKLILNK